jgi:hypothetical protein
LSDLHYNVSTLLAEDLAAAFDNISQTIDDEWKSLNESYVPTVGTALATKDTGGESLLVRLWAGFCGGIGALVKWYYDTLLLIILIAGLLLLGIVALFLLLVKLARCGLLGPVPMMAANTRL